MKKYIFIYKLLTFIFCMCVTVSQAQTDTTSKAKPQTDSTTQTLNMDAAGSRPYFVKGKMPVAIGGYVEANTQFTQTDGINEGYSFQFRRMTLFFSSTITKKIKFMSELEFEDGTKEINIEMAAVDMEFHPLLNLRGGIILNPIGGFNQNHDGPKWDFIDRPISATTIIPSTLSNIGFGLHGKYVEGNWIFGYETYLTNGFDDRIISNSENRTSLAAGKSNVEKFEESNSGIPMFTGKIALRNRRIGEIGISYMSGIYNRWQEDGLVIEEKRNAHVMAVDFNTSLINNRINITGEVAKVVVDVPEKYSQQFGTEQAGAFMDIIYTVLQKKILGWENAKLNVGVRIEYADYNQGTFKETGDNIADDVWSIVPSIAFRPAGTTVVRFNYRYMEQKDILGNPPALTGAYQFGIATYF
ncbi:MAG: hypothetical protein ABI772_13390 [Bacteroidota bacterium]